MAGPDPRLELADVTVRFGGLEVLRSLTLTFGDNPITSLIGPNGAGKTTVFNVLSGIVVPDVGQVLLDGHDITGTRPAQIARMGIVRKFQVPTVFPGLTVRDNMQVAVRAPRHEPTSASAADRWGLDEVADLLALEGRLDVLASELSHGERQWLEIGMAFLANPRFLLLDEPAAGLGPEESEYTAGLIRKISDLCRVIVIEHDMSFIRELGGEVTVLHQGQMLRQGTMDEIEADHVVRDVYLGRETNAGS